MATDKQKRAFNKIVENRGNISKTMKEVGYTKASAQNPKNLTESLGWKELINTYLPNSLLGEKHLELLNKKQVITKDNTTTGGIDVISTGEIDTQAVSKGLDMAYKLKGAYVVEKIQNEVIIDPETKAKVNEALERFLKTER